MQKYVIIARNQALLTLIIMVSAYEYLYTNITIITAANSKLKFVIYRGLPKV